MKKLLILLLLLPLPLHAEDWSTHNKWLMGATFFAFALDGISTHQFLNETDAKEKNFILGEHPSTTKVALYLSAVSILLWATADALPDRYRPFLITPFLVIELKAARHNFQITGRF